MKEELIKEELKNTTHSVRTTCGTGDTFKMTDSNKTLKVSFSNFTSHVHFPQLLPVANNVLLIIPAVA